MGSDDVLIPGIFSILSSHTRRTFCINILAKGFSLKNRNNNRCADNEGKRILFFCLYTEIIFFSDVFDRIYWPQTHLEQLLRNEKSDTNK